MIKSEGIVGKYFKWEHFNTETDRYYHVIEHVDSQNYPYFMVLTVEDVVHLARGFEVCVKKEIIRDAVVDAFNKGIYFKRIKEITKEEFDEKLSEVIERVKNWETVYA